MSRPRRGVRFDVPADVAFGYLVDPYHRAEWQSSLRRVEDVRPGLAGVGQTWVDVTVPGLRALMETTALLRPHTWTEVGRWHGIHATLTLDFVPDGAGCLVSPTFRVTGTGPMRPLAFVVDRVAVLGVYPDLRRAARILADR
ncbi:MAG: Polyketide cyclase / dehydrase and lipid transport [Nocardioides sp.]|nr:Polyketide cyclase / dehydrase and lipid transport [Nocardioides sp.]